MFGGINIKGRIAYPVPSLYYRAGDPSKDVDSQGRPVQSNYVVFVNVSDLPSMKLTVEELQEVPQAFPVSYSTTDSGNVMKKSKVGGKVGKSMKLPTGESVFLYPGTTFTRVERYYAHNGKVYRSVWVIDIDYSNAKVS